MATNTNTLAEFMLPETELAKNIQKLMDARGLRESELARQIQLPQTTVNHILKGITDNPRIDTVLRIATFFNVTVDSLLGLRELPKQHNHALGLSPEELKSVATGTIRVPVIDWDNVKEWVLRRDIANDAVKPSEFVAVDAHYGQNLFALRIVTAVRPIFPRGAIAIVSPTTPYTEEDYVVVSINKNKPTIRSIMEDSGKLYLNALAGSIPSEEVNGNHVIFGKIVETRACHLS